MFLDNDSNYCNIVIVAFEMALRHRSSSLMEKNKLQERWRVNERARDQERYGSCGAMRGGGRRA